MKRLFLALSTPFVLVLSEFSAAEAEDIVERVAENTDRWSFTVGAAATNAAIKIVESKIELPEELGESNFEASLSDDLKLSSTIFSGVVGYRILPFAEVFARGGFISSDSETGVVITGTPNGPFSDFFDGPITIDRETSREVDGYSLGLGANAYLPVTKIAGDTLVAYGTFQYAWNWFDETISSEAAITSFGFIYPVNLDRENIVYRVGGSYNWISRDVEQELTLNGEAVRVRVTQEFEDPWAVNVGIGIPIAENTLLGLGAWHQLSGETSFLASLTYRFGSGD